MTNKKINAIAYAKTVADSLDRQALSVSMQNAAETLACNVGGSAQGAGMAVKLQDSALLAKSGALTADQGADLAMDFRQFIASNPQGPWWLDQEAALSEWWRAARKWARDEALGAGS